MLLGYSVIELVQANLFRHISDSLLSGSLHITARSIFWEWDRRSVPCEYVVIGMVTGKLVPV